MNKAKYLLFIALLAGCGNNKTCRLFEPLISLKPESEVSTTGETETVIEEAGEIDVINNEAGSGAFTFQ